MKIASLILSLAAFLSSGLVAQTMEWLPSNSVANAGCGDETDCNENIVCYTLAYTPELSGNLTSYTAVFRADCDSGNTAIISNGSCTMTDKSQQLDGCKEIGQVQLASSGNTGTLPIAAGETVYLHQICLQTRKGGGDIGFEVDPLVGITTSIDLEDGGYATEIVAYPKSFIPRNDRHCGDGISIVTPPFGSISVTEETLSLTLAPNPTTNYLWVKVEAPGEVAELSILDINGRRLLSRKGAAIRSETIDVSHLPAGTYYLSLGEAHGGMSEKFIIMR